MNQFVESAREYVKENTSQPLQDWVLDLLNLIYGDPTTPPPPKSPPIISPVIMN